MLSAWLEWRPSVWSVVAFAIGWSAGWLMLCRPRRLPDVATQLRVPVSVVIPARNEGAVIGDLVARLVAQCMAGDEVIVVDDHSADDTAVAAAASGAIVVSAPTLPSGWAGKPHACSVGAARATTEVLVFIDADVTPSGRLLGALADVVAAHPDRLVSVQPWHGTVRAYEQLSALFNVTALMGCVTFTVFGLRPRPRVAFGPVIACTRERYEYLGGHAHPDVRSAVLEDIALARRFGHSELFVGSATGTTFRMYPNGLGQLVEGWTKGIGIGVDATPWWATVAVGAWVTSVAGGWLTSPWFALATMVQLAVLLRVAGGFRWWAVVAYPVPTAWFVVVVVRSLVRRRRGGEVAWKGRTLRPDQETG